MNAGISERVPYAMEYQGLTAFIGEPLHLAELHQMLIRADIPMNTTASSVGDHQVEGLLLNSISVDMPLDKFWETIQVCAFDDAVWPTDDSPVTVPEPPAWLTATRCWEYEPAAPAVPVLESPNIPEPGGWLYRPSFNGMDTAFLGGSVGLFQLTDHHSFWVLTSAENLSEIHQLGVELAGFRRGFSDMTTCVDEYERPGSIKLPLICREVLEDELIARSFDIETRFW